MKTIPLGKSGLSITSIVMGMWQAGKQYWVGVRDSDILDAVAVACDNGVSSFDTAEEYGDGESERLLGKGIVGKRQDVILMSKVFSNHLKAEAVVASCERTLQNLGTDYLDLYQIHWPSGSWGTEFVPIEETMEALLRLKETGKIRAIGVSNFTLSQLESAARCGQIDSVQPPYSLFWRSAERELIPYCQKHQITVLAYSPLAQGFLTGKFDLQHQFEEGDNRLKSKLFEKSAFVKVQESVDGLRAIAEARQCSVAQLALAWVILHKHTAAVVGVRNAAQIRQNAAAGSIELSSSEVGAIEKLCLPVSNLYTNDTVPWFWSP